MTAKSRSLGAPLLGMTVGPRLLRLARLGVGMTMRMALLLVTCHLSLTTAFGAIAFGNAAVGNNGGGSVTSFTITLSPSSGSTVVVGVSIKTTTVTVSSVSDNGASGGSTYLLYATRNDSTNERIETWAALAAASSVTTITVNLSGSGSKAVGVAAYYTGVAYLGNTGDDRTSGNTTFTVRNMIAAANNWVVAVAASAGTGTFSSSTGNLRTSGATTGGSASTNAGGWLCDNTSASAPTEVDCTVGVSTSQTHAGAGIELRLAAPSGFTALRLHNSRNWPATTSAAETEYYQAGSGNVLAVAIGTNTSGATVNAPTDSNGTVSTAVATQANGTLNAGLFYVGNASSGKHQFTVSLGASATNLVLVQEFGNVAASPLDVATGATGTSSSPSSGNATTTNANDILCGIFFAARANITAGSGYTLLLSEALDAGAGATFGSEFEVVSETGSYAAAATYSGSSAWIAGLGTFTQSVAGTCAQSIALMGVGCR